MKTRIRKRMRLFPLKEKKIFFKTLKFFITTSLITL